MSEAAVPGPPGEGGEAMHRKVLGRALAAVQGDGEVLVGPWTGEVGFELLYWIPFLNWLAEQAPGGRRMVVVSRGGAAPWYWHLTTRYVDVLDLVTPEQFREQTAGKKKQYDRQRPFDQELLALARTRLGLGDVPVVHPSAMFRLFAPLWRGSAGVELVESYASFHALGAPALEGAAADLPTGFVVAKFYFSKAFPDTAANRAFVSGMLRTVSREAPVALLSTAVRLDDHADYRPAGASGLYVVDTHGEPSRNLAAQTALIAGGRGFVGTYGGFSYLAPFCGVPSLSFFSRRNGFQPHHLELAHRVFDRLCPDGFVALDTQATALVEPAVARWLRQPGAGIRDGRAAGPPPARASA